MEKQNINDLLFKLPVKIDYDNQLQIVNFLQKKGFPSAMNFNGEKRYLWKTLLLRHLDYEKLEPECISYFKNELRSIDFCLRNRTDLPWTWNPSVPSELYQDLFKKLEPYIINLTRVQILLQRPSLSVPLHTDLMPGQEYNDQIYKPLESEYIVNNNLHASNQFMTIKIPITDVNMDNGYPNIEYENEVYNYDVGNYAFAINESDMRHGAMACGHYRGVICLDGLFNIEKMKADASQVEFRKIQHDKIFRRVMTIKRPNINTSFIGHDDGRGDIRAILMDYSKMRLSSPYFLGAAFFYSEDRLSFVKHEYWSDEKKYRDFFFENRPFIENMIAMYNFEEKARGLSTHRTGAMVDYATIGELDKLVIKNRMHMTEDIIKNQSFYQ